MQVLTTRYPEYLVPPPLGDPRENATTWTVTKKWIDARRATPLPATAAPATVPPKENK
jgi:hypothetical protein